MPSRRIFDIFGKYAIGGLGPEHDGRKHGRVIDKVITANRHPGLESPECLLRALEGVPFRPFDVHLDEVDPFEFELLSDIVEKKSGNTRDLLAILSRLPHEAVRT